MGPSCCEPSVSLDCSPPFAAALHEPDRFIDTSRLELISGWSGLTLWDDWSQQKTGIARWGFGGARRPEFLTGSVLFYLLQLFRNAALVYDLSRLGIICDRCERLSPL
jgi:hypothetical protein